MGFLDDAGLAHLWGKMKSYVSSRRYTGTPYGSCSTGASTVAKTVNVNSDGFTLASGASIRVKFTNSNTASNPTLNVNGTGAKAIKRYGTTAVSTSAATSWNAGAVVDLSYDGTYWYIDGFNNTSYSSMTVTEYEGGSGTSARLITPARLKAAILHWGAEKSHSHDTVSTAAAGFAPQLDGSTTKYLRADGTWATPPSGGVTPADYIVETGTDGVWSYQKYNSGEFDAMCRVGANVGAGSAFLGGYFHAADAIAAPSFMKSGHIVSCVKGDAVLASYVGGAISADFTSITTYWLNAVSTALTESQFGRINMKIHGSWK